MAINRRSWLKQISLGAVGLGLSGFRSDYGMTGLPAPEALIRLVANENPYGPSPMARKAMADAITQSNRYGADLTNELKAAIAAHHGVGVENILMGAGSTQILEITGLYAAVQNGSAVLPQPTFDYFTHFSAKCGLKRIALPANAEKTVDLQKVLQAIKPDTRLVYICNPNNPTGTLNEHAAMVSFLEDASKKSLVLVDEAYIDFTDQPSVCNMVSRNPNIIVAKTFSKIYGLAGARVGYAIAHPSMIAKLAEFTAWPNGSHSVVSTAAALASLRDTAFVQKVKLLNQQNREYTLKELRRLGLRCISSHTNFIYFSLENYPKHYFELLKNNQIIGSGIYEESGKWSRITIGTKEEMDRYVKAIS